MARFSLPRLGPAAKPMRWLRRQLPPLNFITLHYCYFIGTCLISAIIFWGSSTPPRSVSFTDSLFLTVSAMTLAGLNTINLSTLNTWQQVMLFILIMMGSAIFVSAFVVQIRRTAFEKKFADVIVRQRATSRGRHRSRSRSRSRLSFTTRSTTQVAGDEEAARNAERDADRDRENIKPESGSSDTDEKAAAAAVAAGDAPFPGDDDHANDRLQRRDTTPPARRGGPEMNFEPGHAGPLSDSETEGPQSPHAQQGVTFRLDTRFQPSHPFQGTAAPRPSQPRRRGSNIFTMQGVGARPSTSLDITSPVDMPAIHFERADTIPKSYGDISKYLPSATRGWIARNSQFHGLTEKEREKLGGCEYRAVCFLNWLVPAYFVAWQLFGCIGCAAWVGINASDTARSNGLNPWWVGAFNAVSAFNNSGMSLLDANMTAFQDSYYLLITMSLLILAGNTCYPIFLRMIVRSMWSICKFFALRNPGSDRWSEWSNTLRFLLDHPRRCYTNLFPAQHTWWLLAAVFLLNGVDWAGYEILNIGNPQLANPTNVRVIDGLFQAFAVRNGGFYVVPIATLRISLQVLYVVMMYISVYPVVITMRNSNVYEERSLGIYAEDQPDPDDDKSASKASDSAAPGMLRRALTLGNHLVVGGANTKESNGHFVRQQLRAQLAHDAWWIVLALFLIMIVENANFVSDPVDFSVFNFIFEIVSAYGTVGISVGVPYAAYSFCGAWGTLSKLILCAVMLRGRHRGLPVAIDKAVLLPGEENWRAEEEDGKIRMARTMSRGRPEFVC